MNIRRPIFFRMNKTDVGLALTFITFAAAAFGFGVDAIVRSALEPVKLDFVRLDERFSATAERLEMSLANHRAEVNALIQTGLEARENEIVDALVARVDSAEWYHIQIANVPTGSDAYAKLYELTATFDAPKMMAFGNAAAFDFWIARLDDERALRLKSILDMAADDGFDAAISLKPPPDGASRK